jgi:hypothetical protein
MRNPVLFISLVLGAASLAADETHGAENAAGLYLLGTKTTMAGFVPPPGTYFVDVNYFYAGDASGTAAAGVALRRLGNLSGLPPRTLTIQADIKLDGDAQLTMPSVLWVAPSKVLGGNVGFGAIVPTAGRRSMSILMLLPP